MNRTWKVNKLWQEYHQLHLQITEIRVEHRKAWPNDATFCATCLAPHGWVEADRGRSTCCSARLISSYSAQLMLEERKNQKMDEIAALLGSEVE